ncbi:MAG TPA: hypothetical protein VHE35_07345 [Kofleriaceae bacterium]|nr:hypothetical protein [Kofleriaceae bacterium]
MSIVADWTWWTYFILEDRVATRDDIVAWDVGRRWLRYRVRRENPVGDQPAYDDPSYDRWRYELHEATYQFLWVDPHKRLVLPHETHEMMIRGERPPEFLELVQDPEHYFAGARMALSGGWQLGFRR